MINFLLTMWSIVYQSDRLRRRLRLLNFTLLRKRANLCFSICLSCHQHNTRLHTPTTMMPGRNPLKAAIKVRILPFRRLAPASSDRGGSCRRRWISCLRPACAHPVCACTRSATSLRFCGCCGAQDTGACCGAPDRLRFRLCGGHVFGAHCARCARSHTIAPHSFTCALTHVAVGCRYLRRRQSPRAK